MNISARNQFVGRVLEVQPGAVNSLVYVSLGGGDQLVAVVTNDSVESLGLAVGSEVVAIVKAPWVMLSTDDDGLRVSARNQIRATVVRVERGAVNAEVTLVMQGGNEITSVVTKEAVAELGLQEGVTATAIIKASSVILAVPA